MQGHVYTHSLFFNISIDVYTMVALDMVRSALVVNFSRSAYAWLEPNPIINSVKDFNTNTTSLVIA